jgi:predicted permease
MWESPLPILFDLLAIVSPVFACAAIGWIWKRMDRPFDSDTVTGLTVNIGTPCIVFDTLTRLDLSLADFGLMAAASVVAIAGFALVGIAWLFIAGFSRAAFLPALMFPNSGNMGLPVCLFAFGEAGLGLAVSFFAVMILIQFTVGVAIAAGQASLRMLVTSPVVYALAITLVVMALDLEVPEVVGNTTRLLAGFTIPVMLIALGVSIASLKVSSLAESLAVAVTRMVLGFGIGTATAWAFALPPVMAGVLILQSSLPVAVFSYLFALKYNRSPETLAGAVVLSTVLSFAFLPVVLYLVLER